MHDRRPQQRDAPCACATEHVNGAGEKRWSCGLSAQKPAAIGCSGCSFRAVGRKKAGAGLASSASSVLSSRQGCP